MRAVTPFRWPYRAANAHRMHEFTDPATGRILRVMGIGRIEPEDAARAATPKAAESNHRHRHSFDQLYLRLRLPLPSSGADPVDPISGTIEYRPEGLWYGPFVKKRASATTDSVAVFCGLQTPGASGARFITREQVVEAVAKLERDGPGRYDAETGDYVTPDGRDQDFYEITWETATGRTATYPEPARADEIMTFPVTAYPWKASRSDERVSTKQIVSIAAGDPEVELVKLAAGGTIEPRVAPGREFTAILAGRIRLGGRSLTDLTVLDASLGTTLDRLTAEEPSLLWIVRWRSDAARIA
jgi:hypothetical protein